MSISIIEDLNKKIEKYEKIRLNQLKANKNYYAKNKDKIIESKKHKYNELKMKPDFKENQKLKAKTYYENNKESVKKKNLERYHKIKAVVEFPEMKL